MRRQLTNFRIDEHSQQSRHSQTSQSTSAWNFTKCVAVFIPFNGKFATFCSLGQTWKHQLSWFYKQASYQATLSSSIAWPLAGVLWKAVFPHCIAMHTLLVKVRIEVNAFLFHVKSKYTVSSYCVQVSYQVPHFFTCKLTCIAHLNNISLKLPIVLCLFL